MKLRGQALAPSSRRTRASQWSRFCDFSGKYRLECLPASVSTVCLYIGFLSRELGYSTIVNYVVSLVSFHHAHDFESPDLNDFKIKEALSGVQRRRLELPNCHDVILPYHLHINYGSLEYLDSNLRATFWAACPTAFYSLLRSSNLFAGGRNLAYLRVSDFVQKKDGAVLSVRALKNSRFKESRFLLRLLKLATCTLSNSCLGKNAGKNGSRDSAGVVFVSGKRTCFTLILRQIQQTITARATEIRDFNNKDYDPLVSSWSNYLGVRTRGFQRRS